MHTGCDNDGSTHSDLLLSALEVGNDHHFDIVASDRARQDRLADSVFVVISTELLQQATAIAIGVRVAVSYVDLIIVVGEGDLELERVVVPSALFLHRVLKVGYAFPIAVPAQTARSCRFFHRVEQRLLSLVVGTVGLDQVHDREFVLDVTAHVRNFEVEPLCVDLGLVIVLQEKVVCVGFR